MLFRSHRGIAGSEWVLFEESSHTSLLEEPERYLEVIGRFLERVESQAGVVSGARPER